MRAVWILVGLGAVACGGDKKPAKDPSETPSSSYEDTPKWEGASNTPSETAKPTPGKRVTEEPTRRSDQYDKEATDVVLKRSARLVHDNCGAAKDENGKATGPWGKLTVQVLLAPNGHGKGVTVPEPYAGKPVGNCIEKAFANLTFPPWSGTEAQVPWDVELLNPAAK